MIKNILCKAKKVYLKVVVSSCELEQPSSLPCSWHCSSKNHSTSAAAPGCALSSEAAQTRWQQQNTHPKPDGSGQAPTLRESLEFKANGCSVSSGRTARRSKPKTSTGFRVQVWELLKQKGSPWKTTGTKHLGHLSGEHSTNCLKHFCDMQPPDLQWCHNFFLHNTKALRIQLWWL